MKLRRRTRDVFRNIVVRTGHGSPSNKTGYKSKAEIYCLRVKNKSNVRRSMNMKQGRFRKWNTGQFKGRKIMQTGHIENDGLVLYKKPMEPYMAMQCPLHTESVIASRTSEPEKNMREYQSKLPTGKILKYN